MSVLTSAAVACQTDVYHQLCTPGANLAAGDYVVHSGVH